MSASAERGIASGLDQPAHMDGLSVAAVKTRIETTVGSATGILGPIWAPCQPSFCNIFVTFRLCTRRHLGALSGATDAPDQPLVPCLNGGTQSEGFWIDHTTRRSAGLYPARAALKGGAARLCLSV